MTILLKIAKGSPSAVAYAKGFYAHAFPRAPVHVKKVFIAQTSIKIYRKGENFHALLPPQKISAHAVVSPNNVMACSSVKWRRMAQWWNQNYMPNWEAYC